MMNASILQKEKNSRRIGFFVQKLIFNGETNIFIFKLIIALKKSASQTLTAVEFGIISFLKSKMDKILFISLKTERVQFEWVIKYRLFIAYQKVYHKLKRTTKRTTNIKKWNASAWNVVVVCLLLDFVFPVRRLPFRRGILAAQKCNNQCRQCRKWTNEKKNRN